MAFERAVTDFRTVRRKPGHQQILEFCLDHGLEINRHQVNLAAQNGNDQIIRSMEDRGLPDDPFVDVCLGVSPRVKQGKLSEQVDEHGSNLLHYGAGSRLDRKSALTKVCRLLLDEGVPADRVVMGALPVSPAFRCAAFGGNPTIMDHLLKSGQVDVASLHLELEFSLEPHQRSGPPFYDVAESILAHGFEINSIRPDQGRTLLHGSANRGTLQAVRWLLEHGADPNAVDRSGRTPLHVAAERNTHTSSVQLLLEHGADPTRTTPGGDTARDIARTHGREEVERYLQAFR
ncbi:MAG: ankyrin repeat domain-containing protein [Verrucomicrobiales bacterium]